MQPTGDEFVLVALQRPHGNPERAFAFGEDSDRWIVLQKASRLVVDSSVVILHTTASTLPWLIHCRARS